MPRGAIVPITREAFMNPVPPLPDEQTRTSYESAGDNNNIVALHVQQAVHQIISNPTRDLHPLLYRQLRTMQGLTFAGVHPSVSDLYELRRGLEDLQRTSQQVIDEVRELTHSTEQLIEKQNAAWDLLDVVPQERKAAQDIITASRLAGSLGRRLLSYGSARFKTGHPNHERARWLMDTIVHGFPHDDGTTKTVLSGGGPGIMDASNRGALEGSWKQYQDLLQAFRQGSIPVEHLVRFRMQVHSLGIGLELPHEQEPNPYVQAYLHLQHFAPRKVGLLATGCGRSMSHQLEDQSPADRDHPALFVFMGGCGTQDELWEAITLYQCNKVQPSARIPIFIIGEGMKKIVNTAFDVMEENSTINPQDRNLVTICDDVEQALERYMEAHNLNPTAAVRTAIDERKSA